VRNMRDRDTLIMCPQCHRRQHAMSLKSWKTCENTKISFQCKTDTCGFNETRNGILWMNLVRDDRDKNGC